MQRNRPTGRHALSLSLCAVLALTVLPVAHADPDTPATAAPQEKSMTTGVIKGEILDEGGLAIPGVSITLTSDALIGGAQQLVTDENGRYLFPMLPPGTYTLIASRPGFMTSRHDNIQVLIGRDLRLTIELALEGSGEAIVVMESTSRPQVLSKEFLERVPTGRSYQSAASSSPGVVGRNQRSSRASARSAARAEAVGTEDYTDYGVNEWTEAEEDARSTFSIDVDTASYAVARRKITSGSLPPISAVRVEEFLNYFDYDYVGPDAGADAPFAVNMEAAPHPFHDGHHLLRIGVQGREIPRADETPIHLTFLVDTSGSMSSADKLGLAQRALHELVDNLEPDDTVALSTYAGSVSKVLGPTAVREAPHIHEAIDRLRSGGSTAMESGIQLAYSMASEAQVVDHENRVIILSDGDANVGASNHEALLKTIKQYAEEGITLSTVGFGMGNYKDTTMEQLANQGDGNYSYIDSFREAQKVFGDDLAGTLQVIAKDVKIQVEFDPEAVESYRLVGYENRDIADKDFRNDKVDAGEIGAGHQVTALYEVVLTDSRVNSLATVRLRARPPGRDRKASEWETSFPGGLVEDSFEDTSDAFRLAVSVAMFAEMLRGSPELDISYERLYGMAFGAHDEESELENELMDLMQKASRLSD